MITFLYDMRLAKRKTSVIDDDYDDDASYLQNFLLTSFQNIYQF